MSASTVLIIGGGDMADRLAHGLAGTGRVRRIVFATASSKVEPAAAAVASCHDVDVRVEVVDARNSSAVAGLLRTYRPDLVVQSAALMSPWALGGRTDPIGRALASGGLGLRLPLQIPVLLAVMRAVHDVDPTIPVANLSFPDITHPLLHRIGLAPTTGLGNVSMYALRARAALRVELGPDAPMPLIRAVGQHGVVYDVMNAERTGDLPGPWIWLGDAEAERRDDLAYRGRPMPPSVLFNAVTAAASMPVLDALLPGGAPLRWSVPGPLGLLGGYPVRIDGTTLTLDLPDGVALDDCIAQCAGAAAGDGIDRVDADGTVHFTEAACATVHDVAPHLAEPFVLADADRRAQAILDALSHLTR